MKKKLISFAVFCALSAAAFADTIDMSRISGKFKDDIVVINKSLQGDISINISIKTSGDFQSVKDVQLNFFDDELMIHSKEFPNKMKPKDITEVQVDSLNDNDYICKASIDHDNLVIEVRDSDSDLRVPVIPVFDSNPDAFTFDGITVAEKLDENCKIKNQTSLKGLSFKVSVYDMKTRKWVTYGTAEVNGHNDVTKVKSKLKLGDYRYFAVEALDGQSYGYMPIEDDYDLIINVSL